MSAHHPAHHTIEVRLILETDRLPKDVLAELVYFFALRPSRLVVVREAAIRKNHRLLAAYEQGGEVV